jgi:serine/threonine protein kinase
MCIQEASLLARLNHPNIVSFWESFVTHLGGQKLFIVMEFADGGKHIFIYMYICMCVYIYMSI